MTIKNRLKMVKKREATKIAVPIIVGLAVLLVFAGVYFNYRATVGRAVFVGETPWTGGEIDLTKESYAAFALPSASQKITLRAGISPSDPAPKSYTFSLTNKGSQLYGYELSFQGAPAAQDTLYAGGAEDSSPIYLNLDDTIPDLKVWYIAAVNKIVLQNVHAGAVCGNSIIEGAEECDSANLAGKSCQTFGFTAGALSCTIGCRFDKNACSAPSACLDSQKTATETDVDCGGTSCPKCVNGKTCAANTDCLSNYCENGICKNICPPNEWLCEGSSARKQCKADGSGYNAPASCASAEACSNGLCAAPIPVKVVAGTKISLGEITPANNTFSTLLTATDIFSQKVMVYTVLYDANGKVLKLEPDEISGGMAANSSLLITVEYPQASVKKKSVIVFDVEPNPAVFGKLEETYS